VAWAVDAPRNPDPAAGEERSLPLVWALAVLLPAGTGGCPKVLACAGLHLAAFALADADLPPARPGRSATAGGAHVAGPSPTR
jgi:hypothetical protein